MKKNGVVEHYYDNGQLGIKETWKNGKLDGVLEIYYGKGKLHLKGAYKDGKLIEKEYTN